MTPANNLTLPKSSIERKAMESLSVKISKNSITVENTHVLEGDAFNRLLQQKEFMIPPLFDVLVHYAEEAKKMAAIAGNEFSGQITIQGDTEVPYAILTRVMYTCGQAGYPNMNLFVYKKK